MANQLNDFDSLIKNSLDGFEVPYDPNHWDELEDELQVTAPGLTGYFSAVTTGLVITSIVFMGMLFFTTSYDGSIKNEKIIVSSNDSGINQNTDIGDSIHKNASNAEVEQSDPNSSLQDVLSEENEINLDENSESEIAKFEKSTNMPESLSIDDEKEEDSESTENSNNTSSMVTASKETNDELSKVRTGCTGMTIHFDASEQYGNDASYLWNFGDGYFSNEANPSHTFIKEGIFDVSLSVTSPSSGQITSNVVQAMIEVVEAPMANLELEIQDASVVSFSNKSYNASEIQWKINNEIVSAKSSIQMNVISSDQYQLELLAYNEGGCMDNRAIRINSVAAGTEFPKAFETSYGTTFAPGAIVDDGNVTSLKIFNKESGEIVFEGTGNKGWNGKMLNGQEAELGFYKWVMAVEKSNSIDVYHGTLQLR